MKTVVSVVSFQRYVGNTALTLLLGHGLADYKRNVFVSHVSSRSKSMEHFLGIKGVVDNTMTPSQLVKLMKQDAIKPTEIEDYCKRTYDYLDVFTPSTTNFYDDDMNFLIDFILESEMNYDYLVFDIDKDLDDDTSKKVILRSDIIVLAVPPNFKVLDEIKEKLEQNKKLFKNKLILVVCTRYNEKVCKLKDIANRLGVKSVYMLRDNKWVTWASNTGKLTYMYTKGKLKDASVLDVYKDSVNLANAVSKARVAINKKRVK